MRVRVWTPSEVAAAQEAMQRLLLRRRQDPEVAARRAAAAALRQRLGVPESRATYWTPDPEHPTTKVCSKCGVEKSLAEFYLRRKTGRRLAECRACVRARVRKYYAENLERCRAKNRRAHQREDPETRRARRRRYRERHPREAAVRSRFKHLRRSGALELDDHCADCGGAATDMHHESSDGGLILVSLCHRCHMQRHFAQWRKTGGGPVKYPWEYDEDR